MEWSTEKPKVSGYYWIYTVPVGEDEPVVMIVEVNIINEHLSFNIPSNGYECEDEITPKQTTHYMGVVQKPTPPNLAYT